MSSAEGERRGRDRLEKADSRPLAKEGRKCGSFSIPNWEIVYVTCVFKKSHFLKLL
jgi:hypothetical protein